MGVATRDRARPGRGAATAGIRGAATAGIRGAAGMSAGGPRSGQRDAQGRSAE